MGRYAIYPIKDVYLGVVEKLENDDFQTEIWPFHKKIDKLTGSVIYIPIREQYEYYYLQKIEPIKKYMSEKDTSIWLTIPRINQIAIRENKRSKVEQLVSKEMTETTTIQPGNDFYGYGEEYQRELPKQKVMQFSRDHAA